MTWEVLGLGENLLLLLNALSTNFNLNTYCYTHRFVQLSIPPREGLFAVVSSYYDSQLVKAQRISECGVPAAESDFLVIHFPAPVTQGL